MAFQHALRMCFFEDAERSGILSDGKTRLTMDENNSEAWRIEFLEKTTWQRMIEPVGYRIVYSTKPARISIVSESDPSVAIAKWNLKQDWAHEIKSAMHLISIRALDTAIKSVLPWGSSVQFDGERVWDIMAENPAAIATISIEGEGLLIHFDFPMKEDRTVSFSNPNWKHEIHKAFFPFSL